MAQDKPVEIDVLRSFSPLDGLKRENLHALAKKTRLQELDSGRVLFKEGESDKRTIYLVGGELELRVGDRTVTMLRAGTPEARIAVAPGQPRRFTARALSDVTYVAIDSRSPRRHDHLGPDRLLRGERDRRRRHAPMATTG